MERKYLTVSLLAAVFLSLVQISVQQGVINYPQIRPPVLITNPLCGPGWERDPTDAKCRPWCESGCKNGYCHSPNSCECYPGFVKSLSGDCVEECPMSCLNGYCDVITNVCTCHTGYTLHPSGKFCIPQCRLGCDYPYNCTAPETCTCPPGQVNRGTGACENKCDPPCANGKCVAHGQCVCDEGYTLKDGTCQGQCDPPCQHGMCVARNICSCHKKWTLDQETGSCRPICQLGCENGECVAPDRCHCHTGYDKVAGKCVPHCSRCSSSEGKCVAPEKCECNSGYISIDNGRSCKTTAAKRIKAIYNKKLAEKEAARNAEQQTPVNSDPYQQGQQYQQPSYPTQQQNYNYPQQNQQPMYNPQQNQQPMYNPQLFVHSHNVTAG